MSKRLRLRSPFELEPDFTGILLLLAYFLVVMSIVLSWMNVCIYLYGTGKVLPFEQFFVMFLPAWLYALIVGVRYE